MDSGAFIDGNSLNGKNLRVASVKLPPFVEFLQDDEGNPVEGKGFCFEILSALMETYNFTITISIPKDMVYGAKLANGTWTGMVSMLINNESDVGIGSFSVTHARYQVIDFSVPFYEESSAILAPAPVRGNQSSAFIKPFHLQVWLILIAILGLLPLIMWVQSKLMGKERSPIKKRDNSILFFYGVLLTQSGQKIPGNSESSRFLVIVWCLSAMVFIHAYVGTLISFLSVPDLKPVIRSLEELPSSGLGWFVWRGSDLESLFLEAKDGIYRVVGDGLRKHPERLTTSTDNAEKAVINGSFAYMNSRGSILYAVEQDFINSGKKCRLSVAKETFYKLNQALAFPKGSPIGAFFTKKMLMMMESGLMEHWRVKHLSVKNYCSESNLYGAVLRRLTFSDVKSAFLVWLLGVTLSLISFLLESIYFLICKCIRFRTDVIILVKPALRN